MVVQSTDHSNSVQLPTIWIPGWSREGTLSVSRVHMKLSPGSLGRTGVDFIKVGRKVQIIEVALFICALHLTFWEAFLCRKSWAQGRRAQKQFMKLTAGGVRKTYRKIWLVSSINSFFKFQHHHQQHQRSSGTWPGRWRPRKLQTCSWHMVIQPIQLKTPRSRMTYDGRSTPHPHHPHHPETNKNFLRSTHFS